MGLLVNWTQLRKEPALETVVLETSKTEKQRVKTRQQKTIQGLGADRNTYSTHLMEVSERREREKGTGERSETVKTEHFLKLMSNTKPHPGSTENTKQDKCQNTKASPTPKYILFKLQKMTIKKVYQVLYIYLCVRALL